jgi:hypothetical protein
MGELLYYITCDAKKMSKCEIILIKYKKKIDNCLCKGYNISIKYYIFSNLTVEKAENLVLKGFQLKNHLSEVRDFFMNLLFLKIFLNSLYSNIS